MSTTKIWRAILAQKIVFALMVVLGAWLVGFNAGSFFSAYAHWPEPGITLSSRLSTWDSAHYLILSERGYQAGSHSCAFYPLWPALIHAATVLTFGHRLLAGLLLANGLSLVAFWLFYRLVERHYGAEIGRKALVLLLVFPGAIFFCFPYFRIALLGDGADSFLGLENQRYFWPCVMAFFLPLTKAIGVFLVFPIAWHLYEQKKPWKYWLLLLAPVLGYAAYFGVMYAQTGNAFEGFEAQKAYPNSPSIKNMLNLPGIFNAFVNVGTISGMMDSALDRGFFILFLALLPLIYRMNRTWFFYTLPAGLVPAMTSWFMSYRRYIMVGFPIFIVLAQLLQKPEHRWLFWYYVAIMAALQVWAITQFVNFNWAG